MTHGRGKKAGRGAGLRGGRGNAGLGKHRIMHMLKYDPNHFGRYGFKRHAATKEKITTINVGQLEEIYPNKKSIDLTKEGYTKLLGGGKVNTTITIKVASASEKAIEKIAAQGGEVKIEE
jgi:large subunit ribosomal protein L15